MLLCVIFRDSSKLSKNICLILVLTVKGISFTLRFLLGNWWRRGTWRSFRFNIKDNDLDKTEMHPVDLFALVQGSSTDISFPVLWKLFFVSIASFSDSKKVVDLLLEDLDALIIVLVILCSICLSKSGTLQCLKDCICSMSNSVEFLLSSCVFYSTAILLYYNWVCNLNCGVCNCRKILQNNLQEGVLEAVSIQTLAQVISFYATLFGHH